MQMQGFIQNYVNVNLKYLIILTFYRVDYEIASIHVLMGFRISETLF